MAGPLHLTIHPSSWHTAVIPSVLKEFKLYLNLSDVHNGSGLIPLWRVWWPSVQLWQVVLGVLKTQRHPCDCWHADSPALPNATEPSLTLCYVAQVLTHTCWLQAWLNFAAICYQPIHHEAVKSQRNGSQRCGQGIDLRGISVKILQV